MMSCMRDAPDSRANSIYHLRLVSIGIDQGIVPLVWDVSDKGTNDLIFALWVTSKANAGSKVSHEKNSQ